MDYGGNVGTSAPVPIQVIPDPLTTVQGRVVDQSSAAVVGATVTALGRTTTSGANGAFTLSGLPTILGPIVVTAVATIASVLLGGVSPPLDPIVGGVITIGDIRLGPKPFISSLAPTTMLAGTNASFTVTGANLGGSTFVFTPSGINVTSATINGAGTSATLNVSVPAVTTGRLTLVATNPAGTSDSTPIVGFVLGAPAFNTISVPGSDGAADPDRDGLTNTLEIAHGTDPLNADTDGDTWVDGLEVTLGSSARSARSVPNPTASGYVSSVPYSMLNNRNPGTGVAGATQFVTSRVFSILNALNPSTGTVGSNQFVSSLTFSALNTLNPGNAVPGSPQFVTSRSLAGSSRCSMASTGIVGSNQFVSSRTFSALNSLNPGSAVPGAPQFVTSRVFSILNSLNPSTGMVGSSQYVSSLTFSLLNARSPAPVGPVSGFVNGRIFSIANGLPITAPFKIGGYVSAERIERIAQPWRFQEGAQTLEDSDRDGIPDQEEILMGTNPTNADTDQDGFPDGLEVVLGSKPARFIKPTKRQRAAGRNQPGGFDRNRESTSKTDFAGDAGHCEENTMRRYALIPVLLMPLAAQVFNSGSTGADGALNLTTPGTVVFDPKTFVPPLDPDGDGIYNFTTINIAAGVTVRLRGDIINAPVVWLAQGAVTINGAIDAAGSLYTATPFGLFLSPTGIPTLRVVSIGGAPVVIDRNPVNTGRLQGHRLDPATLRPGSLPFAAGHGRDARATAWPRPPSGACARSHRPPPSDRPASNSPGNHRKCISPAGA